MYYRFMLLLPGDGGQEVDAIQVTKGNNIAGAILGALVVDTFRDNAVYWKSNDELNKMRERGELAPA